MKQIFPHFNLLSFICPFLLYLSVSVIVIYSFPSHLKEKKKKKDLSNERKMSL